MDEKPVSRRQRIKESYAKLRDKFWGVPETELWHRTRNVGFISIPRGITLISLIMDKLAAPKKIQLSSTYIALWCHTYDESLVVIKDEGAMAFEAGFTGQRRVNTWKTRMKELVELGFIKAARGPSGPYHYVLILNPYKIIKALQEQGTISMEDETYTALFHRATDIGADKDL